MKVVHTSLSYEGRGAPNVYENIQYLLYLAQKNQRLGRPSKNSVQNYGQLVDRAVFYLAKALQYYAVNFLFFGSHSAHFLHLRLDSAPTESLGSKLPFRAISLGLPYVDTPSRPG